MSERVLNCIYAAIDEANEDRPDFPALKKSPDTPINGAGTELDSLALINLLVAVEDGIERELEMPIALTDDRAFTKEPSPFESVATLAEYAEELLREHQS